MASWVRFPAIGARVVAGLVALAACRPAPGAPDPTPRPTPAPAPAPAATTRPIPPGGDPRMSVSAAIACQNPGARAALGRFERAELGADWWPPGPYAGRGLNVHDFDGDGHLDVFVPQAGGPSVLLFGDGTGALASRPEGPGLPPELEDVAAATGADLDADGDVDLVAAGFVEPLRVLWNDGAGGFVEEPLPVAAGQEGCGGSISIADMDLDGDLDVFHGRVTWSGPEEIPCGSLLFEGQGDGAFLNVSDRLPAEILDMRLLASGWLQMDDDPWPELYTITDEPGSFDGNRLVDNDGAVLTPLRGLGLEQDMAGMGLGVGDLNGDGRWDLVVPGIDEIVVAVSSPFGVWVDSAASLGIVPDPSVGQSWGWGGELEDMDDDGLLDLPLSFGPARPDPAGRSDGPPEVQPDELFWNQGSAFVPVAAEWGLADPESVRAFEAVDLNEDGWLDLVKRLMGGGIVVYLSRCGESHWLQVRVAEADGNRDAIGATVAVFSGGGRQLRPIEAGSTSFSSSAAPEAHFGLGADAAVEAIEVWWPDGEVTHHPGVGADRVVTITRGPDPG